MTSATAARGQGPASDEHEVRRALLIGIDSYIPAPPARAAAADVKGRGPVGDLEGTNNDVDAMRDVLVARYGFTPANVHILLNAEATHDRILGELQAWLVDAAAPGDVSLFFYAGHGSQVLNSKSQEADKKDETIVPADANLDKPDIRDKELARLFDRALDRKVRVTAIFDSCHSGSIARGVGKRGRVRSVAPDMRDIADPDMPVAPETRGALIVSAAQDIESANEVEVQDEADAHHGLFTWALVKTLRTMPVNESAERMFLSVRGLMQSTEVPQEPVLAGTDDRRKGPVFGVGTSAAAGTVLAVQSIRSDGSVILQGGRAAGVRQGAELRQLSGGADSTLTLRVVEEQGLSLSRAEVVRGDRAALAPGVLFAVTKWAVAPGEALRVWIRSGQMTAVEIAAQAAAVAPLLTDARVVPVDDPTAADGPTSMLQREDAGWQFIRPDKSAVSLGTAVPTASAVAPLAAAAGGGQRLMVDLPLPAEAASALGQVLGASKDLIERQTTPEHADYVLVGRVRGGRVEYAWVRPLMAGDNSTLSTLPPSTAWIALGADPAALAHELGEVAVRLAAIRNWLNLESPADQGTFPYHLALKHSVSGDLKADGTAKNGDPYGLVLALDDAMGAPSFSRRYVYAFDIDSDGKSTLLFPLSTGGNVENLLPLSLDPSGHFPKEIPLGPRRLFTFVPGIDTFVLVTTATPLPDPTVLEGEAVRAASRGPQDPLSLLLSQGGAVRRQVGMTTPTDWSIERFTIRTTGT